MSNDSKNRSGGPAAAGSRGTWSERALQAVHHPSLKDRVVIITGGSRGFGWFMAEELLRAGGRLLPGDIIVPPAVWLCTDATNGMTGERVIARFWDGDLPPHEAFRGCLQEHVEEPSIM